MFNDERINSTCGAIYRRGILLAVLYTALFGGARILLTGGFRLSRFLTEAAILAAGGIILLIGLIRWGFARDERAVFEKHNYYLTAGKVFVVAALAGYAVSIPLRMEVSNDYPVNELILHLETLGCVYFFFAFKRNSVSFNYTFIDEPNGGYYRRVLINIAKLAGILLVPFLGAAMLDLMMHQSFPNFLVILAGYAASVVELGLDYLLLSALEKMNYDEESPRGLKKGTIAAMILAISAEGVSALLAVAQGYVLRFSLTSDIGKHMNTITTAAFRWVFPCIIITALSLAFLMEQTLHSKWIRRGVGGVLILQALDLALVPVRSVILLTLDRHHTPVNQLIPLYGNIMNAYSALLWLLTLACTCLIIHGLIRDRGVTPLLWLSVAAIVFCYALGIFLGSQSLYLLRAVIVEVIGTVLVAVCQLLIIQKTWKTD